MAAQVIFRTQGVATSFTNTTNRIPIFLTPGAATRFLNTFQPTPFFQTGAVSSSFLTTNVSVPLFLTPSEAVSFFTTADRNTTKQLTPNIGTMEVSSGYTYVNVPDATGDYNSTTNPGGYNVLPSPFNAARPYRDNVALWTVYRIWNVSGSDTISPDEQNEQYVVDYEYQLFFPTETNAAQEEEVIKGVYEIILIAAPYFNETDTGGTYASYSPSGSYYNLVGTGTTFLTTAEPEQYLFYEDANGQFIKTGQIFQVVDDTNLLLYDAPEGSPSSTTQLFTSYSLNTETASYADYSGVANLYEIAKQYPGWFVGSAGLLVDALLINCLSRLRYEFLQGVMCGNCDEGYLHTYSLYIGMLNAMEAGEWLLAVDFYNKLKVICAERDASSCGC